MRVAETKRTTKETDIYLKLAIDGSGKFSGGTGVPFLDHMLTLFAKHGLFDLEIKASGDLHIDDHHTVEDIGIVLGETLRKALGDKKSIRRYGFFILPMDEVLATAAVDLSERAYLSFDAELTAGKIGNFDAELVEEFFRAFANNARMTLHIKQEKGANLHHQAEAIFKACARALDMAATLDQRVQGIPSTKGVL